jgi:hypothetical protein
MFKQIQNYINFLIVCLIVCTLCFAQEGCTDPAAYNCADDNGVNYTFEIGGITYVNGCNYELNDMLEMEYIGGCESGPCEGYYDPDATSDDGSCDYYQSPHGNDIVFTVEDNEISVDWTAFTPPESATILGYHVSRCIETGCVFITNSPFPWGSDDGITETSIIDVFAWESGVEIKYVINVRYLNAENYGMAIGASYITPGNGDMNGDGGWNVLDIVILSNCILADNCTEQPNGWMGDLNGDGGFNVLDIVILSNCILADSCGS